jgi:hypothetical protein
MPRACKDNASIPDTYLLIHQFLPRHTLERQLREARFLLLYLVQLFLDRIADHELDSSDRSGLSKTVLHLVSPIVMTPSRRTPQEQRNTHNTVYRLTLHRRVPVRVNQVTPRCGGQVETHTSCPSRHKKELYRLVQPEFVHRHRSFFACHRTVQSSILDFSLVKHISNSGQVSRLSSSYIESTYRSSIVVHCELRHVSQIPETRQIPRHSQNDTFGNIRLSILVQFLYIQV